LMLRLAAARCLVDVMRASCDEETFSYTSKVLLHEA
jgi:hypothetical protein